MIIDRMRLKYFMTVTFCSAELIENTTKRSTFQKILVAKCYLMSRLFKVIFALRIVGKRLKFLLYDDVVHHEILPIIVAKIERYFSTVFFFSLFGTQSSIFYPYIHIR